MLILVVISTMKLVGLNIRDARRPGEGFKTRLGLTSIPFAFGVHGRRLSSRIMLVERSASLHPRRACMTLGISYLYAFSASHCL